MSFQQEHSTTTTEQLPNGGKRVWGTSYEQGSRTVNNLAVAKGMSEAGDMEHLDKSQTSFDITYNANGKKISEERHTRSATAGFRSDEITSYDNNQNLKDAMLAQYNDAEAYFRHQKGVLGKSGSEDFSVTLRGDGSENYQMMQYTKDNKVKTTSVYVDASGKLSGYTMEQRADVAADMKEGAQNAQNQILSAKKLNKLRKQMQKRGNKVSQEVSGQNMENYRQDKQGYTSVSGNEPFIRQSASVDSAYQSAKRTGQEQVGIVKNVFTAMTPQEAAEALALQKLKEQQQK